MQSLILGTAQWGLDYGVTNPRGRLTDDQVRHVTLSARRNRIAALDTAPAYGDAEARIGQLAPDFVVQTKVSAAEGLPSVEESLEASRLRLGAPTLWSVLVHDWPSLSLAEREAIAAALEEARAEGGATRVGISGYTRQDIASALECFRQLDVVQMPVSVLDQRLEDSPEVAVLRSRGGLLQARSVLLQGVATGATSPLSDHPDVLRLKAAGDPLTMALGYVHSRAWVDEVVVGATSSDELDALAEAWAAPTKVTEWAALASHDEHLIDPRTWRMPS